MKNLAFIVLLMAFSLTSYAQKPDPTVAKIDPNSSSEKENTLDEKEEFEKAINQANSQERITLLLKFIENFPESEKKTRVLENIVRSRAELADEKLRLKKIDEGVALFKLAVKEAPMPVSNKLFSGLLVNFPANLFVHGQGKAAFEVAKMVEEKAGDKPTRLLRLAKFYLNSENGTEAKRLSEKALELDPQSADAYHTIGFANRLDFNLEAAAKAFANSLELNPESINTKISLAEMKRALGLSEEAITLYQDVLEKDANNAKAKTGLILSLFDADKKDEAERRMAKTLEQNPNNLPLLVGAAYWYAANKNGDKAVELAQKVIGFERRYTWTYIALARGYMAQGKPLAAERALLTARQYGNFPTLVYELAYARLAAGFYREAVEGLKKSFELDGDQIKTRLGGRIVKKADTFIDLLSFERRASIFQVNAADDPLDSLQLKDLLNFMQKIETKEIVDIELAAAADKFIGGDDKMKTHRQIFIANQLLKKKKALPKVLEITKNAVFGVDSALDVESPSSAVLAEELYESRTLSLTSGRLVIVPDLPRQILSSIIRGRIEEAAGWALFEQEKLDEAKIRLKRAISVFPKDSVWSQSSLWRLGGILKSEGKSKEALDTCIKSYASGGKSTAKRIAIEDLYSEVNGNLDGLEERLGGKPTELSTTNIFLKKPQKEEKPIIDKDSVSKSETEKLTEDIPLDVLPVSNSTSDKSEKDEDTKSTDTKTAEEKLPQLGSKLIKDAEPSKDEGTKTPLIDGLEKKKEKEKLIEKPKPKEEVKNETDEFFDKFIDLPAQEARKSQGSTDISSKPLVKKEVDKNTSSGLVRARVVPEKDIIFQCDVTVSMDTVSIEKEGRSFEVLVGLEKYKGKTPNFKAISSSPVDVEAIINSRALGASSEQASFLIKSVSGNTGLYNVEFETPCGKKKITVKVR